MKVQQDNKKQNITLRAATAEYLTFVAANGKGDKDQIECRYEDENIWLTQKLLAMLYGVSVPAVNQHIKKIFADGELEKKQVIKKYLITASDDKQYWTTHYNLQMIIAVGFKINNECAVQFRRWANQILKDYTIQGWVMDKQRLIDGHLFTDEFFERLLQQIREIRMSERKFYQKVTDIYATAFDYNKDAKATKKFFQTVQNKLHFAVCRHTAPELIVARADAKKPYMGLTNWKNAPDGKILKADVTVTKKLLKREGTAFPRTYSVDVFGLR